MADSTETGELNVATSFPRIYLQEQGWPVALIDDYDAKGITLKNIQDNATSMQPQSGEGSPEGSVAANNGQVYYDVSGSGTVTKYFNPTPGSSTGWRVVAG